MSYKKLEIWQKARELTTAVHHMTLNALPKFEMFEEGSQVRRSMKSVRSNIVEGYGRRLYKQEFLQYLNRALASCDESTDHLEMLFETGSLADKELYEELHGKCEILARKLNLFMQSVEEGHISKK